MEFSLQNLDPSDLSIAYKAHNMQKNACTEYIGHCKQGNEHAGTVAVHVLNNAILESALLHQKS